jgi:antitoxin component YwqK of YwqJK toxin-antitoxin module
MADLKKFEEMLQKLVNEDKAGAEELFHEIVVEKSRDIYESLLEDDLEDEEVDEATDEEVDESDDDELEEADDEEVDESDDDELEEGFDLEEFEVEAEVKPVFYYNNVKKQVRKSIPAWLKDKEGKLYRYTVKGNDPLVNVMLANWTEYKPIRSTSGHENFGGKWYYRLGELDF